MKKLVSKLYISDTYQNEYQELKQPSSVNKRKQNEERVQNKQVFLYKPYDISAKSSRAKMPELTFIQDEVNNLNKFMKIIQAPVKTMLFYTTTLQIPMTVRRTR